jgi:hypothetical protein
MPATRPEWAFEGATHLHLDADAASWTGCDGDLTPAATLQRPWSVATWGGGAGANIYLKRDGLVGVNADSGYSIGGSLRQMQHLAAASREAVRRLKRKTKAE